MIYVISTTLKCTKIYVFHWSKSLHSGHLRIETRVCRGLCGFRSIISGFGFGGLGLGLSVSRNRFGSCVGVWGNSCLLEERHFRNGILCL